MDFFLTNTCFTRDIIRGDIVRGDIGTGGGGGGILSWGDIVLIPEESHPSHCHSVEPEPRPSFQDCPKGCS